MSRPTPAPDASADQAAVPRPTSETGDVRNAVVTGGTRGIGRAVSLALARQGLHVCAMYARNREAAEALEREAHAEGLVLHTLRADLSFPERLEAAVAQVRAQVSRVDVLVHSAASGVHRPVAEVTPRHLSWTFNVNVLAFHQLLIELLPLMPSGARVVGLTSQGGVRTLQSYAAVGASKGALEALFRYYARELAPRGIIVNMVCPGLVLTEALEAFPEREQRVEQASTQTPTGRLTTPEDVAQAVLFLCGPAAAQIVGHTLVIDGGRGLS